MKYIKLIILYASALAIGKFIYKGRDRWIISERGNEARDNGYFLFNHIKKHYPKFEVYYIISDTSNDFKKLSQFSEYLVRQGSFKHYILTACSKYMVSTHVYGAYPDPSRFKSLNRILGLLKNKRVIFLQHGIIKDHINSLDYPSLKVDLFVSGAKREFDFLKSVYHQPEGVICMTGLPRYDTLYNVASPKRQILFMPTWRRYLTEDFFADSLYYQKISEVLESDKLHKILEENNFTLIFYPHFEIHKFLHYFRKLKINNRITIADFEFDVQTLLKESAVLITDYSSVYIDFAYMKKPILIYAFDEDDFYSKHYAKGEYDGELFGTKTDNLTDILNELSVLLSTGCNMPSKYKDNTNTFFGFHDNNCCERVIARIKSL